MVIQHVWVHADVVNLATGAEQRTNDFRFTWGRESGPPLKRMIVPKTYGGGSPLNITWRNARIITHYHTEAMQWLEGRRALEMGSEIRKLRKRPEAE